ncbi:MAG TPA: DUF72 domain-containing protein [Acidobacteriota bacterium]|nr:DUF72 domain-containing protein [Acidobacteriota bacterium]
MSQDRYQFRDLFPGVHFGTASDRYAGWVGQIYAPEKDYRIRRSQKTLKGKKYTEEKVPVESVREYFEHYSALELDFTFYAFLANPDDTPTRNAAPLAEYAKWVPPDGRVLLKVPQAICAERVWSVAGGRRAMSTNPDHLDPAKFTDLFYHPACEVLGDRIAAFIFEKGYQRKADCVPADENIADLEAFFAAIPDDERYHIEERTDRLKTPEYFDFLRDRGIGNVFSHWTWLPDLGRQWEQSAGFTSDLSITRLMTPPKTVYEEAYARYFPFDQLKDEFPQMYRDAAQIIREGMTSGHATVTIANNRAGGNANEINLRILAELER